MSSDLLSGFSDLLEVARRQPQPQRLLFVLVRVDLPESPTAAQRERHARGEGGTLAPVLCVDKSPDEIASFTALAEESASAGGSGWDLMFVAALAGRAGIAPTADEATRGLRMMVEAIEGGQVTRFAAFDREGAAVAFC